MRGGEGEDGLLMGEPERGEKVGGSCEEGEEDESWLICCWEKRGRVGKDAEKMGWEIEIRMHSIP